MTTLDQIRTEADTIRRHLQYLDESDARLKRMLAENADSRRMGLAVLAMAEAELVHTTTEAQS